MQSLFVFNPLYTNIIPLVKISILLLYTRLFPIENVRRIVHILIGILACFEISTTFVDIFGCWPIESAWNKSIHSSRCVVPQTLYMATAGINLTTDVIVLCIPMPLVWRLRLSTKRKSAVSFIFVLGALVCVTTIFRITTFKNINSYDLTWSYIDTAYWTYSELVLSFICACIPTFRPVIHYFFENGKGSLASNISLNRWTVGSRSSSNNGVSQNPTTTFDSSRLARQQSKPMKGADSVDFAHMEDPNSFETRAYKVVTRQRDADVEKGIPSQGIHVQSDVHQSE